MTDDKNNPENNDHMPDNEPISDAALRGNADFDSPMDASEYRTNPAYADVPLESLAVASTSQYALTEHALGDIPTDSRKIAIRERRDYGNANTVESAELSQELAARRYSAFSVFTPASTVAAWAGQPVLLLGEDLTRTRALLTNGHATASVVIGPLDQVSTGNGFLLIPGVAFETKVTDPIYACIPVGGADPITVGVWAEYA